jgi:hypothetical protein
MLVLAATMLVICAPGSPGNTAEAQPAVDALAQSIARAANLPAGSMTAVYDETEGGCLRRLAQKDAALLLATLPLYLAHEQQLRLTPRLFPVPKGGEPLQRWTLVTKDHPPSLEGYTVLSSAGYSKRFVRAMAPKLPAQVEIQPSSALLSGLRRAANGEKVAVLLDGAETAAMGKLPFAAALAAVDTSPPVPVGVLAAVAKRMDERRWKQLEAAFLRLSKDPAGREALDGMRLEGFAPLDEDALTTARAAYRRAR